MSDSFTGIKLNLDPNFLLAMMHLLFSFAWLLFAAAVSAASSSDELSLNLAAVMAGEIKSVHHNQTSRQVIISLDVYRRCNRPTFMVRISGTTLYILDQLETNNRPRSDTHVFEYPPLVDPGQYFVEVLSMYCKALRPKVLAKTCLISPMDGKNVLTLPYSFTVNANAIPVRPRWVLARNATPALLPTRYQKKCGDSYCESEESEIAQHNLYEWTDKPAYAHLVNKTLRWGLSMVPSPTGKEAITICMVGDSHAGHLFNHGNSLNITNVRFWWIGSRFPQLFNVSHLANCTYAVVGYGQWPLSSWMGKEPYSSVRYETEMRKVVSTIAAAKLTTQVFLQSMNLNALGYRYTKCPTGDYRHPPIVMMYNSIVARLSAEYKVPYIDMFPIQGPLWDIALDWSHPLGRVFTAEAEFVVHSVLSHSHQHSRAPHLDPDHSARVMHEWKPVPVRFNDSDTVFLRENGEYRAIQSWKTLAHLGYSGEGKVAVVDANRKADCKFGPVLPDM